MNPIRSFRDLEVWQRSMDLVELIIEASRALPPREFELRRQMRDAATSIPANVAEGWRRKKRRAAYQNHVSIAMGSQESWRPNSKLQSVRAGSLASNGTTS